MVLAAVGFIIILMALVAMAAAEQEPHSVRLLWMVQQTQAEAEAEEWLDTVLLLK